MDIADKIKITMLPAGAGDCILIEFIEEDYRILIDGGYSNTYYNYLKKKLLILREQGKKINLLVITHIDADHIGGILAFLKDNGVANKPSIIEVEEVWYNAFFHMNKGKNQNINVPYITREILRGKVASNDIIFENGRHDISVAQGNTVAGLLINRGYNWNSMYLGNAVCVENGECKKLTEKIQCTLLGPDEKALNKLAELWITKMESVVKNFTVCGDILYSEAFECDCMQMKEGMGGTVLKDIAYKIEKGNEVNWKKISDNWKSQLDTSNTNRSSIAFMLEYEGIKMIFPGDCPLQLFQEKLPTRIDILKLPHHGSEKNIDKEFIMNTEVTFYLLSTEGKIHGHPSLAVIGSILYKAAGKPTIIKNYDIHGLDKIGIYEGYENGI